MANKNDSERFQAWLQDAFEAMQPGSQTLSIGPFRAVITPADEGNPSGWVTLVDVKTTPAEAVRSLAKLQAELAKDKVEIEVEYDVQAFPKAGKWFEDAGLKLEETNPLLACRPATFVPFAAPDVSITRLDQHAKPAELEAFQKLRWSNGGDLERQGPSIDKLRTELASPGSVYLLAWVEWEPVGTGVSHVSGDAAEIVGVVTRNDRRRRGVAAAVTTELVRRHFESGGDFVFLDAADDGAAKVYERLGFTRFGAKAVYR